MAEGKQIVTEISLMADLSYGSDWISSCAMATEEKLEAELGCGGEERRRGLTQRVGCDRGNMADTRAWEGADADHRRGLSMTADSWQSAPGRTAARRRGGEQSAVQSS
ncbi:hypothetical protein F2Q68_00025917 [Brassica cretica]|uniref:Uncharacterized protein n=1 Tax=Brassica cretica TaxID=69181 RepID=A0A8S9IJD9_BRACR|nr:hypothetical protein F2Q68_00025917 [Brassica cretica]